MKFLLLYLLLLKATATSFAGLASLPVLQDDLVTKRHLLTEKQLNQAIVITRSTPGPMGLYVVSAGYFAAGWPGAIAGWLAMITPALLVIPLVHFAGRGVEHPRVKAVLQAIVVASAGLLLGAAIPLAQSALAGRVPIAIAIISLGLMFFTKTGTLWIILGAAIVSISLSAFGLVTNAA